MKRLISICFCLTCLFAQAQEEFGTGLLPDDGTYETLPMQAPLVTRGILPSSYSLLKFCPEVKSQGGYSTCTGWATAYAARTILEAVKQEWTDRELITREAFSPLFVYAQIKNPAAVNCNIGTSITDALYLMKEKGVSKYSQLDVQCADNVSNDLMGPAKRYKIDGFKILLRSADDTATKLSNVKRAISENKPVVIGMYKLPPTFQTSLMNGKEDWDGDDKTYAANRLLGHAMCVIGYDDNRKGGSFQIMNSWINWGNKGIGWVKYNDFLKYTQQAYELILMKPGSEKKTEPVTKPAPKPEPKKNSSIVENVKQNVKQIFSPKTKTEVKPTPKQETKPVLKEEKKPVVKQDTKPVVKSETEPVVKPKPQQDSKPQPKPQTSFVTYDFAGSIELQLSTGEMMVATQNLKSKLPSYKITDDFISRSRFKIFVSNDVPAYVYVIGSDLGNNVSQVFPPKDKNISAALTYKSNKIDLFNGFVELDDTKGTDYMCVLYSIQELDIKRIVESIKNAEGSFYEKVRKTIGDKAALLDEVECSNDKISFHAHTSKTLVPLIVEISHK